jgi:peptide/nickel transport system substrate-binding protein
MSGTRRRILSISPPKFAEMQGAGQSKGSAMPGRTFSAAAAILFGASPATVHAEAILTAVPMQLTAWVENYNPYSIATRLPSVQDFIFEPLFVFNTLKNAEPNFRLATGFTFGEDLESLTVTLRKGVEWSDGEEFDAGDVTFTYDMLKRHRALDIRNIWDQVEGVTAVDDHTLRFDLTKANTGIVYTIAQVYIVPEHIWRNVEDPVTFTNPDPVGSGPLTEIRRFTAQEYVQCRNADYWDAEHLKVDCMRFPQIANNDQALAAAAAGELDWFGSFLPDIDKTYVARDPEHHKYWFPPGSLVFVAMNFETENEGNRKAFNDLAFRRAFSMAMDRRAMVEIAGYGYPTVNEYASGLGRAYHAWNNPKADARYGAFARYDAEAAKTMLAEAGYRDADGDGFIETPDGDPIAFDILVPNGWTDWVNTVQLAVEGLTAIGIDAGASTPESPLWQERLTKGDFDVAISSHIAGPNPFLQFNGVLHSRNQGKTRFAPARYSNRNLDALLDSFYATADEERQRAIMDEVQMVVAADMPIVPIFNNPRWYEYNTRRFEGFFSAENPGAVPTVHDDQPERLLHLLALRPRS